MRTPSEKRADAKWHADEKPHPLEARWGQEPWQPQLPLALNPFQFSPPVRKKRAEKKLPNPDQGQFDI